MTIVRNNERSEAIKLISFINAFLRDKTWSILSAGGESTIADGKKHMFPDVILYGDSAQTQILQGWELKMPDVPIDDEAFVKDAKRKAITLGLNSCFIWNFATGILYKRNDDDSFTEIKRWNDTNYIKTRADVDTYRTEWMRVIGNVLEEINSFFISGQFLPADLSDAISDTVLCAVMQRNKYPLSDRLKGIGRRDVRVHAKIQNWWKQIKAEYASEEKDAYVAYARVVILNWCNRILFAHVIKRYHNAARGINLLNADSTPQQANELFASISRSCDFYNIFVSMEYNDDLPECMWRDLMELNGFLSGSAMTEVNQSALQKVLERTISSGKRELIGQYTTPDKLASILARIAMRNLEGACIDPCCGTGTIAQAMLGNKIEHGLSVPAAYETTWASEKFSFPLQIASISLARVDAINQPLRVFQKNAFELAAGQEASLIDPATGNRIVAELPLFDTIASNLPFVPFEIIEEDEKTHILSLKENVRKRTKIKLDNRSDLYQYFVLTLHGLLNRHGRLGIITSNSWLGTKAGRAFFEALGWYYQVEQVHISGKGRWFHNADVVAVMLILTKRDAIAAPDPDETIQFYIWKKALQEMQKADVEALVSDAILGKCSHPELMMRSKYSRAEIGQLSEMSVSLNALFHGVNWLKEISDKLCPVTEYLCVTRGERRGWDKMFYPADGHGIEPIYIKKVLKSSKQLTSLCAAPDSDAFCCSVSMEELERFGHKGALAWIRAFENGTNTTGKPLVQVLQQKDMYWYEMRDASTADYVTGMNPDGRLFVAKFDEPTFVNQRFIAFKRINHAVDADLLHALLNSMLSMFYIEAIGFGRGLGVLDINATNIRTMMILNPALLSEEDAKRILQAFEPLKERKVLGTAEELKKEDRIRFDHAVLSAFGIDHYYDSIKRALLSMQQVRKTAKE